MTNKTKASAGFKSIRTQLVLTIGLFLLVLLALCSVFILKNVSSRFRNVSDNYLHEMASYYSESTKAIIAHEYATCSALKTVLEQVESVPPAPRRDFVNAVLREALVANENFVDTWVVYEPNALDGLDSQYANTENHDSTGRFIPYWTKVGSTIECTPLTDYEDGFWYVNPLKSPTGILIDPNPYEIGGKTIWVCGVAFPIHSKSGKPIGVIGLDMSLDTLSSLLKQVKVYDSGYLSLISDSGLVAVDYDSASEGQNLAAYTDSATGTIFKESKSSLQPFGMTVKENGESIYKYYQPFKVEDAKEVWFLGLNAKESEITAAAKAVFFISTVAFVITTIIILLVLFVIIQRVVKEMNKGVSAMQNIAQGDGDLTVRMEVKTDNELGKMYKFFNLTIEKIQNSIAQVKESAANLTEQGNALGDSMNDTAASANEITASMDEMSIGIESINKSINNVNDMTHKNTHSIESLGEAVSKFKV